MFLNSDRFLCSKDSILFFFFLKKSIISQYVGNLFCKSYFFIEALHTRVEWLFYKSSQRLTALNSFHKKVS